VKRRTQENIEVLNKTTLDQEIELGDRIIHAGPATTTDRLDDRPTILMKSEYDRYYGDIGTRYP
jgi:hypothetical protein